MRHLRLDARIHTGRTSIRVRVAAPYSRDFSELIEPCPERRLIREADVPDFESDFGVVMTKSMSLEPFLGVGIS